MDVEVVVDSSQHDAKGTEEACWRGFVSDMQKCYVARGNSVVALIGSGKYVAI